MGHNFPLSELMWSKTSAFHLWVQY